MDDQPAPTRRERKAVERRERIIDAAIRIFAAKGFHRTTTREIATAADVGEGTIFNYFGSKDELLIAIIDRLADVPEQRRLASISKEMDYRQLIRSALRQRLEQRDQSFQMLLAVLPEIMNSPDLRTRFYDHYIRNGLPIGEEYLRARIERGDVRPLDIPLTVRLLRSLSLGMSMMALLGDEVILQALDDPDHLTDTLLTLIFDGIENRAP